MKECDAAFDELKNHLGKAHLFSKPNPGKNLILWLAIFEVAVSSVLVREEGQLQLPLYYVIKAFQDAETRTTIKEQALVDFVVESSQGNVPKSAPGTPKLPACKLYMDGSSGEAGFGVKIVLISPEGHKLNCALRFDFKATNNVAEYEALRLDFAWPKCQLNQDSQ
ncbi:Ribonuclease H [Abeliophyllum distichum]|uniref:Ribonuclease H n=1 Tax=Abeliophyllum distichum TaxID=126358 RepID=A0ABD1RQW3_9LAMI